MCLAVLESERACKLVNTRCVSVVTAAARRTRSQMRMHGGTRAVGEQWGFTEARSRRRSGGRHTVQEALGGSGQAQRIKLAARLSYLSSRSRSPSAVGRYLAGCAKAKLELFRCCRWNAPVPMDELGSGLIVATDAHLDGPTHEAGELLPHAREVGDRGAGRQCHVEPCAAPGTQHVRGEGLGGVRREPVRTMHCGPPLADGRHDAGPDTRR